MRAKVRSHNSQRRQNSSRSFTVKREIEKIEESGEPKVRSHCYQSRSAKPVKVHLHKEIEEC